MKTLTDALRGTRPLWTFTKYLRKNVKTMQEICLSLDQIHSPHAVNVLSKNWSHQWKCWFFFIFRYTCTYAGEYQGYKMYSWNTTVSDHCCCLGCDGTVYKADSVIEETSHKDACLSVETSICRRVPGKQSNIFDSVRSSRSHNVRLFVRPVLVCLELYLHLTGSGFS